MSYNYMPLIDVCEAITDGSHYSPQEDPNGAYYMASVRDMGDYEFDFSGCKIIGEEDYRTMQRNGCCPEKGDILIGKDGANFYLDAFIYDQEEHPAILSSIAILKPNRSIVNHEYLFAYLRSPAVIADVRANYKSGSAIPRIVLKDFKRLPVWVPDIETQSRIARVYTAFNHKIRLNQKTNDYLAALVRTEFDYRYGADTPTVNLSDVLTISTKSLKPSSCVGEVWEHFSIPAFDEGCKPVFEPADGIKSNKYVIDNSCILISKLNPSTKRLWLPYCTSNRPVCSTEFIVYKPKVAAHKSFYYAAIDSPSFTDFLLAHVTGSTGSRQRTQPKATLNYPMPFPGIDEIEDFCAYADPLIKQWQVNEQESVKLAQLRDTLLPKLMSGEVDVSQVELPTQPNNHLAD